MIAELKLQNNRLAVEDEACGCSFQVSKLSNRFADYDSIFERNIDMQFFTFLRVACHRSI